MQEDRVMWLLVLFDLPVVTVMQKKRAALFRKNLLKNGFCMLQYSVYKRHFITMKKAEVYIRQIKLWLPSQGHVIIIPIPDKSYAKRVQFYGHDLQKNEVAPSLLTIF